MLFDYEPSLVHLWDDLAGSRCALLHCSWDDSSSVSSGLSDTLDNVSTDDLNTPAYSAASSSRKNKGVQVSILS